MDDVVADVDAVLSVADLLCVEDASVFALLAPREQDSIGSPGNGNAAKQRMQIGTLVTIVGRLAKVMDDDDGDSEAPADLTDHGEQRAHRGDVGLVSAGGCSRQRVDDQHVGNAAVFALRLLEHRHDVGRTGSRSEVRHDVDHRDVVPFDVTRSRIRNAPGTNASTEPAPALSGEHERAVRAHAATEPRVARGRPHGGVDGQRGLATARIAAEDQDTADG